MLLHVHTYGDPAGEPLVCLHGLTGNGPRFRKLAEERFAHRRVLAPDLRGHGASGAEPPWRVETHVADLLETVDAESADWVGYSFGGLVAAALAASAPERVRRLALLEPALELPPGVCLEMARAELEDVSFADEAEAIADRLAGGTLFHTPREMLEEESQVNMIRGDDGRLRYRHARPAAIAAWSELAAPAPPVVGVPTLVVVGERSWIAVDRERYPDAVIVPGGHSVLWDAFDQTADALERFL